MQVKYYILLASYGKYSHEIHTSLGSWSYSFDFALETLIDLYNILLIKLKKDILYSHIDTSKGSFTIETKSSIHQYDIKS